MACCLRATALSEALVQLRFKSLREVTSGYVLPVLPRNQTRNRTATQTAHSYQAHLFPCLHPHLALVFSIIQASKFLRILLQMHASEFLEPTSCSINYYLPADVLTQGTTMPSGKRSHIQRD